LAGIGRIEFQFAPFGAPAEFAWFAFGGEQTLPTAAGLIRKADPGKMENFVDQDAFEVSTLGQNSAIEQDQAAGIEVAAWWGLTSSLARRGWEAARGGSILRGQVGPVLPWLRAAVKKSGRVMTGLKRLLSSPM